MRETIEMLRHQGQLADIEIVDQCQPGNCLVTMDRARLMQVWINLLLNAQDAMSGEGKIMVASKGEDNAVSISVKDNGPGIAQDALWKSF